MADDLCRDFDKGKCSRGDRCKFYHPKLRICKDFQNKKCDRQKCRFLHVTRDEEESYDNSGIFPDHIDEEEGKKNRIMDRSFGDEHQDYGGMYGKRRREDSFNPIARMPTMPAMQAMPAALMGENEMLKQKVMQLQRQIMDLRQMNDTLYEQNTSYRNQLRSTTGGMKQMASGLTSVGVRDLVGNTNYYDFSASGR